MMVCRHCWVRVVPIPQEDSEGKPLTVAGKGDPPNWKHDPEHKGFPTCGRGALRDNDLFDDTDTE